MNRQMMKRGLFFILILSLVLPAFSQPPQGFGGRGHSPLKMMNDLNLTDDQEQQMQELRFDNKAVMIKNRADLKLERLKLQKLRLSDQPNKKKLYAQVEKIAAVEAKIGKAKIDHFLSMRKILSADQFKVFKQKMQTGKNQHGEQDGEFGQKCVKRPCQNRF